MDFLLKAEVEERNIQKWVMGKFMHLLASQSYIQLLEFEMVKRRETRKYKFVSTMPDSIKFSCLNFYYYYDFFYSEEQRENQLHSQNM